jgi:hypothetical protein
VKLTFTVEGKPCVVPDVIGMCSQLERAFRLEAFCSFQEKPNGEAGLRIMLVVVAGSMAMLADIFSSGTVSKVD